MKNTEKTGFKHVSSKILIGSVSLALLIGVSVVFQHSPADYLKFLRAIISADIPPPAMLENFFPLSASTVDSNFRTFIIKFTRPMDATTITAANITMKDALNNAVTGTVTYDSNVRQATWKASADFTVTSNNNPFTLTASTAVKDAAGSTLVDNTSANYTIINGTSAEIPGYPSPWPQDNATSVSIYDTSFISITFNLPLDPTTVTSANWSVATTPVTDPLTTIPGITTYNPYTNSIEILTTGTLRPDTTYAITLSSNIKGANGLSITPYTTRFTTYSAVESWAAPTITWSDFKTDPTVTGVIEIEWNSAMKKSSVEDKANYTLTCSGSSVSLASSIIKWDPITLNSTISNLSLPPAATCVLTLTTSITNLNNTAVATTSRTQTGTVHDPYGGKTFLTTSTGTTGGAWLNLDNCSTYNDLTLANCPSFIFNNPLNVTFSDFIANQSHASTAIFTIPVVKSFTTGDKIVITAPSGGFLVGSATINNVLNNNITSGNNQVVKFSSIIGSELTRTMTLTLNVANNATVTAGQLQFAIDNILNPNIPGTYKFQYKLTNTSNVTIQEGVFNSVSFTAMGSSSAIVRVLDRSNNNPIANVKVMFTAPNIGTQAKTTDGAGLANFASIPDTGMHIEAYILGDSVPGNYLPSWTNTAFDLPASITTLTNTLYLDPANFTVNVTLQHSGIGAAGTSKVDVYASGQNGWISKTVTLSATGTTNVTLKTGAGDYNIGVGPYFDSESGGTDKIAFAPPVTQSVKLATGLASPSVTLTMVAAGKHITGTIIDNNAKGMNGVQMSATKDFNEKDAWFSTNTKTNTDGTFDLAVPSGKYTVTASIPGLAGKIEKTVVVATTDTTVAIGNFTLKKPTRYISGSVLDSNGNPVKNATVNCYNANSGENANSLTNSNGLYVVYISSGTYACETWAPLLGSIPAATGVNTTSIAVASSDITGINFTLNRGNNGNITVTVRNSSGTAAEGYFVWAEKFDKNTKQFLTYGNGASTNQAGQVILNTAKNNAATEVYNVKTLGTNKETLAIANNVNIATNDSNLGIFTLPAYQQTTFNVSGLPSNITEAEINIHNDTTDNWSTAAVAITGGAGSTAVSLGAGSYTGYIKINGIGETTKTFTVTGSALSVSFDLSTTQMTLLTVQTKDGAAAALRDVFVSAFDQDKDVYVSGASDNNGIVSLNLVAGTYLLNASKQNYISSSTTVTVTNTAANNATLVLTSASANIILSVKDLSNAAVASAQVDAVASDGSSKWAGGQTDGNGALTLKVEPVFKWNITARGGNGMYGTASNISSGAATVTITLNQTQSNFTASKPKTFSMNPTKDNVINSDFAKLTIPAGALGKDANGTNISIKNVANTPSVGSLGALGNQGVEISSTDSSGKPNTNLNSSVTTEITLNKSKIDALISSGVAAEKLNTPVGFFNQTTNTWEVVKGSTIYVTRQPKSGDQPITTTITDLLNKRTTDYANDFDYIVHYVFKPNHFTLFAPLAVENIPNAELRSAAPASGKDQTAPCRAAASPFTSFFSRLFNFFRLKTGP